MPGRYMLCLPDCIDQQAQRRQDNPLFSFLMYRFADAEHRGEQHCRGGPDDPCAVPFHCVETPAEVNCCDDTPVHCGNDFVSFVGQFLVTTVITLFEELLEGTEDHAGADQKKYAR